MPVRICLRLIVRCRCFAPPPAGGASNSCGLRLSAERRGVRLFVQPRARFAALPLWCIAANQNSRRFTELWTMSPGVTLSATV
jgi:hypothetical protein